VYPDKLRLKEDNFVTKRSFHGAAPRVQFKTPLPRSDRAAHQAPSLTAHTLSASLFPRLQSPPCPRRYLLPKPYPECRAWVLRTSTTCHPVAAVHVVDVRVLVNCAPMYQKIRQPGAPTDSPACVQRDLASRMSHASKLGCHEPRIRISGPYVQCRRTTPRTRPWPALNHPHQLARKLTCQTTWVLTSAA